MNPWIWLVERYVDIANYLQSHLLVTAVLFVAALCVIAWAARQAEESA